MEAHPGRSLRPGAVRSSTGHGPSQGVVGYLCEGGRAGGVGPERRRTSSDGPHLIESPQVPSPGGQVSPDEPEPAGQEPVDEA